MQTYKEFLDARKAFAECKTYNCQSSVIVNIKPMPNEISIGGSAVAVDCPYFGARYDG